MARPRKSETASGEFDGGNSGLDDAIEPIELEFNADELGAGDIDIKPRRGRKPRSDAGTGARKTGTKKAVDLSGISGTLFGIHAMLAVMVKQPALNITQQESDMLAGAIANVQRHYDMTATQKTMDFVNLATCLAIVYGPRVAVKVGSKRKAPEPQQPQFGYGEIK